MRLEVRLAEIVDLGRAYPSERTANRTQRSPDRAHRLKIKLSLGRKHRRVLQVPSRGGNIAVVRPLAPPSGPCRDSHGWCHEVDKPRPGPTFDSFRHGRAWTDPKM